MKLDGKLFTDNRLAPAMVALSYEQWLVAFIVVSTVAKLAVVYVASKRRDDTEPDLTADPADEWPDEWPEDAANAAAAGNGGGSRRTAADGSGRSPRTTSVVECSTCGAENDAGYRYCGECGGELPTMGPLV